MARSTSAATSPSEMPARSDTGMEIDLDRVPQRERGMDAYEILLSESQERMLLVAERGREDEVRAVFAKWELDAVEIDSRLGRDGARREPRRAAGATRGGRHDALPSPICDCSQFSIPTLPMSSSCVSR